MAIPGRSRLGRHDEKFALRAQRLLQAAIGIDVHGVAAAGHTAVLEPAQVEAGHADRRLDAILRDFPIALLELPDDFPGRDQVQVQRIAEGEIVTRELRETVRIPGTP